jgi:hypothetical protein
MDEQCIADIAACVVGGSLIDRSKVALDDIYTEGSAEEVRTSTALTVYGADKFEDEFKFCVDEILKVCAAGGAIKLRELIFKRSQTNAFPSVFAVILLAFHELIVKEGLEIADHAGVKKAMEEIAERIDRGRSATSPDERRRNIDAVKGMIRSNFIGSQVPVRIYSNHSTVDIDSAIRRSEIELSDYELKQGLLTLENSRKIDEALVEKVLKTICAMANNGKGRSGQVLIGITDKDADAERIRALDGIAARSVLRRKVVGVEREAKFLGISMEQCVAKWKDAIKAAPLTANLRDGVLSSFDYNSYFGLGVLVLTVPAQSELSYYNGKVYWRKVDSTVEA